MIVASYHATIIKLSLFCGTLSPGYARIIKSRLGVVRCSTRQKWKTRSWLKKLARRLGPGHIVNLCFIVVLLFPRLLTWREVVVLEDAYISSQRNHLENVANALDKHLQYNVDKLIFLRNGMREALVSATGFHLSA